MEDAGAGHEQLHHPDPPRCPQCHADDTMPIMYGYPTVETMEAVERGEIPPVVIGGCVVDESNPVWGCLACGHRW